LAAGVAGVEVTVLLGVREHAAIASTAIALPDLRMNDCIQLSMIVLLIAVSYAY
jgi:hypothetical protein